MSLSLNDATRSLECVGSGCASCAALLDWQRAERERQTERLHQLAARSRELDALTLELATSEERDLARPPLAHADSLRRRVYERRPPDARLRCNERELVRYREAVDSAAAALLDAEQLHPALIAQRQREDAQLAGVAPYDRWRYERDRDALAAGG